MASMMRDDLKIVMVGHVDHGKSTLIGRLLFETGSLPEGVVEEIKKASQHLGRDMEYSYILDSLREEREQGITIDTTQVFFRHGGRGYVIIDAPGHVEFVRNMVTGASQADAAIIIVDVAEGVMEQTRRHAYILGLLGIRQVIVVMNKMDVVKYSQDRYEGVMREFRRFLTAIGMEPKHYIPVSAKDGDNVVSNSGNMPWYMGPTVVEALASMEAHGRSGDEPMVYPVQDVYVTGGGRILAGRVESGVMRVGDEVTVLPNPRETRVKSIEVYMEDDVSEAEAGRSIGVTLEDKLFVERGDVLCRGRLPTVSDTLNARIFWMSQEPLHKGERLNIRVATQEARCKIQVRGRINSSTLEELGAGELGNNEVAEAVIESDKYLVVRDFNDLPGIGRFVLVRGQDIVAGGIIVLQ